jgi:hypothetical protein
MRRPAQHHRPGLAAPGWVHPYTGLPGIAVFYNDGGQGGAGTQPPAPAAPPVPPAPTPADLAARGQQQPPAPVPPAVQPLLDKDTGQPMTQTRFAKIMTRENDKGRLKVLKELCEQAGIPFDHENTDVAKLTDVLKSAETARQAQLSDDQRRNEELATREQALQARETAIAQRDADTARERRNSQLEAALVRLGAVDIEDKPNLQDAFAMLERDLQATPDADTAAVTAAADKLKARRPELFGATPGAQTLPPAPSGGPAGGNAPRQPTTDKDAINKKAQDRARQMGLRTDDAA